MLNNRILRTLVTVLMFTQVLGSYVIFGLWTQRVTRDRKQLRAKLRALHERNAKRVYDAFAKLKGVYIKVGQFLSTQAALPPEYLMEMAKMQDRNYVAHTDEIRQRIRELYDGKEAEDIFAWFDNEPLACASIGQVHKVKLKDGRDAVLKVKYPGIDQSFNSDLDLLKLMVPIFVAIIERVFYGEKTGIDHRATISEFVKYIRMELDYTNEVENHRKMYAILKGRDDVIVPKLYLPYCTSATICMEFIPAMKMADFFGSDTVPKSAKDRAYSILVDAMLYQVARFGFFQADTHPGNFLVQYNGGDDVRVVFLDFGCSKQLPEAFRQNILRSVQGYINRDAIMSAEAYWNMGFRTKQQSVESLARWAEFVFGVITSVLEVFQKGDSLVDFTKRNMRTLGEQGYELTQSDRIDYIPEEYIMFGRALSTPPVPFDKFQPTADLMGLVMGHMIHLSMPQQDLDYSHEAEHFK